MVRFVALGCSYLRVLPKLFKGKVKDLQPEGKGYLVDEKGTRLVEYRDGELSCQIFENEDEGTKLETPRDMKREEEK